MYKRQGWAVCLVRRVQAHASVNAGCSNWLSRSVLLKEWLQRRCTRTLLLGDGCDLMRAADW